MAVPLVVLLGTPNVTEPAAFRRSNYLRHASRQRDWALEIHAAALQYVRKIGGFNYPSRNDEGALNAPSTP